MDSKQTFMILAIVAAFSASMIATPVMAQNKRSDSPSYSPYNYEDFDVRDLDKP